ncbi:serine hydrolase [Streptococcus panodentis]|uniref:Serine hydrolase n=1 Tax=Streptococcus panodentis TaxID=1581472 RepID=A0ABS5AUG7_9STRE|nr:serine hydrolase [Streptococcus panodentis]MBP2620219.1 serine hydrolase [Streptococcus panodentis]
MRKLLLLIFLLPALFSSIRVISTENDFILNEEEKYHFTSTAYGRYYDSIPANPNVYKETPTFTDASLSKTAGKLLPDQPFQLTEFHVNEEGTPVFKLKNGQFVPADKNAIYEDTVQSQQEVSQEMWLEPNAAVYDKIPVNGAKKIASKLPAYSKVKVLQRAQTAKGEFAQLEDQSWISVDFLSETDNRMDKVQEILSSKYNKADYSIYVKQLETGKEAGINPDLQMYSASVTKLPYLYYVQEELKSEKLSMDQKLKYIAAVNDFAGAYEPEGSGSIAKSADDKEYSVQDLISRVARESDNVAHNILAYYATNQSDKEFQQTVESIAGKKWDVENRQASARMAGRVMEAVYEQNGMIIEALSQTNYDNQRISKNIDAKVAHKIGDAYDFKHDVAVVYTDSPFVIAVLTNHSDYDTISRIADDVYGVLK